MNPLVTLKVACTIDGKIATHRWESRWITGEEARLYAHELRHKHEAILVGINTVLADNPRLTTRNISQGKSPMRVILDSHGRIPQKSECLAEDGVSVVLMVGSECSKAQLSNLGAHIQVRQAPTVRPSISWTLRELSELQIQSVLVEGGGKIHSSFIQEKYFHRIVVLMAPKIIGGDGISWCASMGISRMSEVPTLQIQESRKLGEDFVLEMVPKNEFSNS